MPARSRAKRRRSAPRRKAVRAHLLVIECNAAKLAGQGLQLGTPFGQTVKALFPAKRIAVVKTSTEGALRADLESVFAEYGRFRAILIVGHSNLHGLELTSNGLRPWPAVGRWLSIFEPEYLFLAACEAGQSLAARDIFDSIKHLREIYGSPVAMQRIDTVPLGILIYRLLADGRINATDSNVLRSFHLCLAGGPLFHWRRSEVGPGKEVAGGLQDLAGTLAGRLLRRP